MQTNYNLNPAEGRVGQLSELFRVREVGTAIMRGFAKVGRAVFRVPGLVPGSANAQDPGSVYQAPNPAAAADVDAIIATIASAATEQTLSGASLDGVVGATEMYPPRKLSLTLSNHADWDATTAVATFYDENDQLTTENLAIPNGGNTTVNGAKYCTRFVSLYLPAQSGAGGTADLGVQVLDASVTLADVKGVLFYEPMREPASATYDREDGDAVSLLEEGAMYVDCETAMAETDTVYVRVAAGAGGSELGTFRNDADTATAVAYTGAKVVKPTSAAGPCLVRFT